VPNHFKDNYLPLLPEQEILLQTVMKPLMLGAEAPRVFLLVLKQNSNRFYFWTVYCMISTIVFDQWHFRRDGACKIGKPEIWDFFPGVSVGWNAQ